MGAWGTGNFENDDAADYLGDLMDELTERIKECLADPERHSLGEEGEALIPSTAQILSVLAANFNTAPPQPDVVVRWRETYLAIFDKEISDLGARDGYPEARRAVIEQTFLRLEQQAQEYWQEVEEAE